MRLVTILMRMAEETGAFIRYGRVDLLLAKVRKLFPEFGAGDGIRTHDPNLGKVVLYL